MIEYSLTKHAERELRKLHLEVQRRIIKKLKFYLNTENPLHFADSIKDDNKVYRYRIGDYRVIFDWLGDRIIVTKVGPRPKVY